MTRILYLTMAVVGTQAGAPINGYPTCRCLGTLHSEIVPFDCDHEWKDANGQCVNTAPEYGDQPFQAYPGDYGTQCEMYVEPAWSSCFDASTNPPTRLTVPTAAFCEKPWCYVDPCNCDTGDATTSSTFSHLEVGKMYYSYMACGESDSFTTENSDNAVGNAECELTTDTTSTGTTGTTGTTGSTVDVDATPSLKPWVSSLALVVLLGIFRM